MQVNILVHFKKVFALENVCFGSKSTDLVALLSLNTTLGPVAESVHSSLVSAESKVKMSDLIESLTLKGLKKYCPRNQILFTKKFHP